HVTIKVVFPGDDFPANIDTQGLGHVQRFIAVRDQPTPSTPGHRTTTPLRLTTSLRATASKEDQHRLRDQLRCLDRLQRMEPLWSPVVATGGNQWQIGSARKPHEQAKTLAVHCEWLPLRRRGSTAIR